MIRFCFDNITAAGPVPNQVNLDTTDTDHTWPFITACRLLDYIKKYQLPHWFHQIQEHYDFAWYPIGIALFLHEYDYFAGLSHHVKNLIKDRKVKILFYYHEADNPYIIRHVLDKKRKAHQLPEGCYLFVSGNSSASALENFSYVPDHELFFSMINQTQIADPLLIREKPYEFTALNRTHKSWRASVMSDLHRSGYLEKSLWSYSGFSMDLGNDVNPIEVDQDWQAYTQRWIQGSPYKCDDQTVKDHNDHRYVNQDLYTKSYCHLVIETHYDADQSDGAFLTEKTFKAIKYGQPFIIVGTAHGLSTLRSLGYRTFDHVIDNNYDAIEDNTQRWYAIKKTISKVKSELGIHWLSRCQDDVIHNQTLFKHGIRDKVNSVLHLLERHRW